MGWPHDAHTSPTNEPTTNHGCTADSTRNMLADATQSTNWPPTRSRAASDTTILGSAPRNWPPSLHRGTETRRVLSPQIERYRRSTNEFYGIARNRLTSTRATPPTGYHAGTTRNTRSSSPGSGESIVPNDFGWCWRAETKPRSPTRYTPMARGTRQITATRQPPAVPQSLVGRVRGGHHPHSHSRHA